MPLRGAEIKPTPACHYYRTVLGFSVEGRHLDVSGDVVFKLEDINGHIFNIFRFRDGVE